MKKKIYNQKGNNLLTVLSILLMIITIISISVISKQSKNMMEKNFTSNREILEKIQKEKAIANYLAMKANPTSELPIKWKGESNGEDFFNEDIKRVIKEAIKDELKELKNYIDNNDDFRYVNNNDNKKIEPIKRSEETIRLQEIAYKNGMDIVNNAIETGTWTESDAEEMRNNFHSLGKEQQEKIFSTLFPAINSGDINIETGTIF